MPLSVGRPPRPDVVSHQPRQQRAESTVRVEASANGGPLPAVLQPGLAQGAARRQRVANNSRFLLLPWVGVSYHGGRIAPPTGRP